MLAVERFERREEPLGGKFRATGEASELCSLDWAGVSQMDGVGTFFGFSSIVPADVVRSVWMVRPAMAGVPERRWESGGWWMPVFIVGSGA